MSKINKSKLASPLKHLKSAKVANKSQPSPDLKNVDVRFEVLPAPCKSTRDNKEYKVIKLENGLVACLISDMANKLEHACSVSGDSESEDYETESDQESGSDDASMSEVEDEQEESDTEMKKVASTKQKMAAAALCVSVGSFSDPPNIPGMAHFLEHMVFMGSEKFPQENDYDSFISKRGGSDNASTDCETTTFYFECLEKYLYRSLDKFAQFFISPLMKRESMTREREAIESEFQMALPNDAYRKEQLLASMFNAQVPVNQFTWGNLLTLKDNIGDNELYEGLHAFRNRHYSAHRMTLCIQARLPMDTLESFVLDCFHKVPNNKLPPLDFKQYSDVIYDVASFNKIYYVIPIKDVVQLDLTWALPSLLHMYKYKPHQYVSWLLGDEGKGSLISYLRKKVYALSIYTGNGETGSEHNTMYAYFTTTLVLTQQGMSNLNEVIQAVFAYINLLKQVGPQERIFKEIQSIEDTSFRFGDEKNAADMVETVAESMQFYPSQDYLTGSELYYEYNPEAIQMVLNHLRPDKMNVMVLCKEMPDHINCNKTEPWFKSSYTYEDIPNQWLETWANIEPYEEFALPEPNQFLTENFALLPAIPDNPEYPRRVLDTELVELWYRFDQKFKTPTAYYYYYLISPQCVESPVGACMLDMYITLLGIQLTEEAYPAQVAELDYALLPGDRGLHIKLNGFNEKLPVLVRLLGAYISRMPHNLTVDMFDAVKDNQTKMYYNKFLKPSSLSKDLRLSLLLNCYWPPLEKHAAIASVTFPMMQHFAAMFVRKLYVQGLVQGNVDTETALHTTASLLQLIGCEPLLPGTYPKIRVAQVPKGEHCCRAKSFNDADSNSYITNYYQSGPVSVKGSVCVETLMLIMEEPLFDILRTKEQLGYNVSCTLRDTFGILGYSITVNSQQLRHNTQHVDTRIEAFIKHLHKQLKKMPDKKLNQFKRDLIKVKHCADVWLREEVVRNWAEITSREYTFDRLKQEVKAIEELKSSEIKKFWEEHNVFGSKTNFRKLSIQVVGNKDRSDITPMAKQMNNTGKCHLATEVHLTNNVPLSGVASESEVDADWAMGVAQAPPAGQYQLQLLSAQKQWNEKTVEGYFISDMDTFKHQMYLYPSSTNITK